jgi:hypothetical protein
MFEKRTRGREREERERERKREGEKERERERSMNSFKAFLCLNFRSTVETLVYSVLLVVVMSVVIGVCVVGKECTSWCVMPVDRAGIFFIYYKRFLYCLVFPEYR